MSDKVSGPFRYGGLWLLAALVMSLSVYVLNGGLLYYFDTAGYMIQGLNTLEILNLLPAQAAAGEGGGGGGAQVDTGNTVNGSRSLFYGLIVAGLTSFARLELIMVLGFATIFASVWLLLRVVQRADQVALSPIAVAGASVFVACFGALPFYLAYVMPDILAPVLILVIALLAGYANRMNVWELALALVLGFAAVLSHPSHLAIAGLSIPVVAVIAAFVQRRSFWIAPALIGVLVLGAVAERQVFKSQVTERTGSAVVYNPYITARLIQDGPAYAYLADHCPDAAIATCALYEALQNSDDPMRLTASHIIFEKTEQLGSLRHLDDQAQKAIGDEQYRFFFSVLINRPVHTIGALLGNTLEQASHFGVYQTIPNDNARRNVLESAKIPDDTFIDGRLRRDQGWNNPVYVFQTALYAVSLVVILALLIKPSPVSGRMKAVAAMLVLGILINAFVCGGLSQPAARYGARVIWLLPLMAVILLGVSRAQVLRSGTMGQPQ
ncbi:MULTISPECIES: hypothetical protein [unclassified Ruegeria]|uniref:hypothetical protein n=1 Tax=unclassified Ruegeria TaxID=2625375 RepID=UPI001487A4BC|nr:MULTISPECIES: hypothetical protein [unclassified Ruegeria]